MGQVLMDRHDSFVRHPYPNHSVREWDRLRADKTELTLTPEGGSLRTSWTTEYRHTTRNLWSAAHNEYLAD